MFIKSYRFKVKLKWVFMVIAIAVVNLWAFHDFLQFPIRVSFLFVSLFFCTLIINYRGNKIINKILKWISASILGVVFVSVLSLSLAILSNMDGTYHEKEQYDYIVIFGDVVNGLEIPTRLSNRLEVGKAVYLKHGSTIIVTGGKGPGEYITEADAMKQYLVDKKIDSENILVEPLSKSTQQNLDFVKEIINCDFKETYPPHILMVSSDYHLFRINLLAQNLEMHFDTVPSDTPRDQFLQAFVREWFAIVKDLMYVIYK